MKKLLTAGVVALAAFSLSACSSKNSDAAKKAYIDDMVALNSKDYNSQDLSVSVDQFKASGTSSADMNKYLNGSSFDFKVGLDSKNQAASLGGTAKIAGTSYKLDAIMGKSGIYVSSADVKSLFNSNKAAISSAAGGAENMQVYNAMIGGLTTPYFLIDSATMDSSLKSSNTTWSDTLSNMFKQQQTVSKDDLTKAFKDVPNADFTQSGDKVTLKLSGKNGDFSDVLKGAASVNKSISQSDIEKALKQAGTDTNIESLNLTVTIDSKAHTVSGVLDGKISDKKTKDTIDFKMTLSSKMEKLTTAITEPTGSQVKTLQDLENSAMDAFLGQSAS